MSVSPVSIFVLIEFETKAHSNCKAKKREKKTACTLTNNGRVHLKSVSLAHTYTLAALLMHVVHVFECASTLSFFFLHWHNKYSFLSEIFSIFISSVCYSIQFKFFFLASFSICIVYSAYRENIQFRNRIKNNNTHTHPQIIRRRDTHAMKMSVKRII